MKKRVFLLIFIAIISISCNIVTAPMELIQRMVSTATATPTRTPRATATATNTATPRPTHTTRPTKTPTPTPRAVANQIYDFVFTPPSPAFIDPEVGVRLDFKYSSIENDVLIFCIANNYNYSFTGSPHYDAGFGSGYTKFILSSHPLFPEEGYDISSVTCTMMSYDQERTLFEVKIPVDYTAE